jgi:hypothetical protein
VFENTAEIKINVKYNDKIGFRGRRDNKRKGDCLLIASFPLETVSLNRPFNTTVN